MFLFVLPYVYDGFSNIKETKDSRMKQRLLPWMVNNIEANFLWCNLSLRIHRKRKVIQIKTYC